MPRPRTWYVATLAVLMLAPAAGCSHRGDLTADSSCGDYLAAQTGTRHAAAARISTQLHAKAAGQPLWGVSLDAECGASPDTKLRGYFAAQQALEVPGESMKQTIDAGDMVLVNTLAYTHATPRRGEVVEFKAPPGWSADPSGVRLLKRVIGAGGDHVTCCDSQHRLTVNGRPLDEPYLYRDAGVSEAASPDAFDVVVPDGRLWLMGDARYHSSDSQEQYLITRDINSATIEVKFVTGRVFAVIDPRKHDEGHQLTVPPTYAGIPAPTGRR